MKQSCPRLLLAALRGGAGKTTLTLGLLAAWRDQGRRFVPFKKGPDYIDPAWHSLAAGCPSHNLDPFLMEGDQILAMVARQAAQADALLIEGNRGLYDGLDAQGTYSTARVGQISGHSRGVGGGLHHADPHHRRHGAGLPALRPPGPHPGRDPQPDRPPPPRRHHPPGHRTLLRHSRCWGPSRVSSARSFPSATWGWCRPRNTSPPSGPSTPPGTWPESTWIWRASGRWPARPLPCRPGRRRSSRFLRDRGLG